MIEKADELLEDDSTLEAKAKSDEMVTDEKGNIIIRGADGKDHLMRPDLMKVLLISRGNKLNKQTEGKLVKKTCGITCGR